MFGLDDAGTNGVVGGLRAVQDEIKALRKEIAADTKAKAEEHKKDVRWRIGTALAVVTAILIAAQIIANAVG